MAINKPDGAQTGNSRKHLPIVVAGGVALLGFLMIQSQMREADRTARVKYDRPMVAALVTARDLKAGEALDVGVIDVRMVVKQDQPWSTIRTEDPAAGGSSKAAYENLRLALSGRTVNRDIPKGDLLLQTDLEAEGVRALGDVLKPGQRAVAVQVDRSSLLGGLLQPNDRVDVLATFDAGMEIVSGGTNKKEPRTVVVLQDVPIAAIGSRLARAETGRGTGGDPTVVLALTPDQAILFTHIQKEAKVSLLLRPREQSAEGVTYDGVVIRSGDVMSLIEKLKKQP